MSDAGPRGEELSPDDPRRPLDPRDYSRRTLLANERTALAWWRTGLTTLTVALGCARVVPALSDAEHQWPYTVIGVVYGLLGVAFVVYGERRRRAVERAVRRGAFAEADPRWMAAIATLGAVAGVGLVVLVVLAP